MSIENYARCDAKGCRMTLRDGDEVYCSDCYSELENRVKQLEKEIEQLKSDVTP